MAGNYAITGDLFFLHTKIMAPMDNKLINFLETALIKEVIKPFPCGHLTLGMLLVNAFLATSQLCLTVSFFQFLDLGFNFH